MKAHIFNPAMRSSPRASSLAATRAKLQRRPLFAGEPASTAAALPVRSSFGQVAVNGVSQPGIQAKLRVSQPGDQSEIEADRVADQVMRTAEPQVQSMSLFSKSDDGLAQRQVSNVEEEDEEMVQTKPAYGGPAAAVPAAEEAQVRPVSSSGRPLDMTARSYMESRFGYNFGNVMVHTDSQATEVARNLNAKAFTLGSDIVFGSGQYEPGTAEGDRLLAHELAHVVQQGGYSPAAQRGQGLGKEGAPSITPRSPGIARAPDAPDGHYTTKAGAVADVPAHVVPKACFVWIAGHGHWMVIPGTGCAHWVAHQMNLTSGATCDSGFSIRVPDVIAGRTQYAMANAQVGDIWENPGNASHVGIVRTVNKDPATGAVTSTDVENDSSGRGGVVTTRFTTGDFYR